MAFRIRFNRVETMISRVFGPGTGKRAGIGAAEGRTFRLQLGVNLAYNEGTGSCAYRDAEP